MRPPILQWKVMLALIAVVIVGASLGSALDSTGAPKLIFSHPMPDTMAPRMSHYLCLESKKALRADPRGRDARKFKVITQLACHHR